MSFPRAVWNLYTFIDHLMTSPAHSPTCAPAECVGSPPLMRMSAFCSPRSDRSRRRRRHGNLVGSDASVAEDAKGGTASETVSVAVRILDATPSLCRRHRRKKPSHCSQIDVLDDLCATIYTNDSSLLGRVGAFEGSSVCCLSSERSPPSSGKGWSPVIIRLLPKRANQDEDADATSLSSLGVSDGDISALGIQSTIYVPPCVAASAGLFEFAPASMECAYLRRIGPISVQGSNGGPSIRSATKVAVRELAASTPQLQLQTRNLSVHRGNDTKHTQDESLRRYFLQDGANGIRDDAPRLMAMGTIFAVPNIQDEDEEATTSNTIYTENGVRFYEVMSIGDGGDECADGSSMRCAYLVSLTTKLVLESREDKWPRRLPSLNQALNFALSSSLTIGGAAEKAEAQLLIQKSQHPSIGLITDKLLFPLSRSLLVSDYITFVVGCDSDHINECVSSAANTIGMRCVSVSGLAAFDYRNKQQLGNEAEVPKQNVPVSGSLVEKLSGLQAAIDMAIQSMPCTVLIKNIDKEVTPADVDAETRIEEEKRFAAVIVNAISKISSKRGGGGVPHAGDWNYVSPPIQFVISSSKSLPPGPVSSLSMGDPVKISRPDSKYARQLWENAVTKDLSTCVNNDQFPSYEEVKSILLGRTAREIVFAAQNIVARIGRGNDMDRPIAFLSSTFEAIDKGPIVVTEGGESRLSSTLTPKIKWEDVGGLSHVRTEVMDAIELPLRHPELFSRGGRGGLCLFGPPGTGKSLIAKAVATECGLPFLSVKGPELLGSYVGESEANVRAAFQNAREAAASTAGREKGGAAILFFDELDSLAPRRGGVGDGGGVMERVVATLLGEMDSGSDSDGEDSINGRVFVIGATNRPDLLDPSLLRPGRFDRLVYLGLAQSREDRIKILVAQTRKFTFEGNQSAHAVIDKVMNSIPASLSGADLSAVAKGALMRSMKRLCDEADTELVRIRSQRNDPYTADIETVVNNWDEKKLVPRVRAEDFIDAAKDVTPSVGSKELANYERLRRQFCA